MMRWKKVMFPCSSKNKNLKRIFLFSFCFFSISILLLTGCFSRVDLYDTVTTSEIVVRNGDEYIIDGTGYCDFGSVPLYESSQLILTIENSGYAELNILSISTISGDRSQFFIDASSLSSKPSIDSASQFTVIFKPTTVGHKSAVIRIVSSDGETFTFSVIGYGQSTVEEPDIRVALGSSELQNETGVFDFGHVLISKSSQPVVFTIVNAGTGNLSIHSIAFISGDTDQFYITVSPLSPVEIGGSTSFEVTFNPTSPGYKSVVLTIDNNDPDENPYEFSLAGYGDSTVVPDISIPRVEPSGSYHFGNKKVGETKSEEFKVKNIGSGYLNISSVYLSSGDTSQFTIDLSSMTSNVPPGEETKFYIQFNPTVIGDISAMVSVNNSDPDEDPYIFTIEGYGEQAPIADIKVMIGSYDYPDGSIYDFGTVFLSKTVTFTIENVGSDELVIQNILLMEGDQDFTLDLTSTVFHITPGDSTSFTIKFDPSGIGDRWRNLIINSNDPDESPYNIRLEGNY